MPITKKEPEFTTISRGCTCWSCSRYLDIDSLKIKKTLKKKVSKLVNTKPKQKLKRKSLIRAFLNVFKNNS